MIQVLQIIALVGTIATGLAALIRPKAIEGFIGLTAPAARGITEIRTVFGAVFIALGAAPLLLNDPAAYQVVGILYLTMAVIRTGSVFLDGSMDRSNLISIVVEVAFGLVLVL